MNELQRQAYLKALGFTPWVASRALPGAAPTPVLEELAEPVQEPQARELQVEAGPTQVMPPAARTPAASSAAEPSTQAPAAASDAQPTLAMHACPLGDVLLLVEQQPADAPDLGRDAGELLDNIVRALKRAEQRRRRFDWPMAHGIGGTLEDFLVQFCQSLKAPQVLLSVSEQSASRLLSAERYTPLEKHGLQWLAISSLQEMLADPVAHKRRSWDAIRQAGFHEPPAA